MVHETVGAEAMSEHTPHWLESFGVGRYQMQLGRGRGQRRSPVALFMFLLLLEILLFGKTQWAFVHEQ